MSKPKLSDVDWMTVALVPVTTCEPPAGQTCPLTAGSGAYSSADAKRHALEHPGHVVYRDAVTRSRYCLDVDEPEATP